MRELCLEMDFIGDNEIQKSIAELHKGGKLASHVHTSSEIDFSVIKQTEFENEVFIRKFLDTVSQESELHKIFECRVMSIDGFFLRYGIQMQQQKYFLLSYSVYIKRQKLAHKIISEDCFKNIIFNRRRDPNGICYDLAICRPLSVV